MSREIDFPSDQQFGILTWRGRQTEPNKLWYSDPLDALVASIEYLRSGYKVQLMPSTMLALRRTKLPF